jgi:hypothetical protein
MYNKLFGKILRSSVWCEDYPTRIVWVAFLASMDEDGMVDWATPKIAAAIAGVTVEEAENAIQTLQAPDPASGNQENEGRRIERFPGGWHVLNCKYYKDLATREDMRQQARERMRKARIKGADVRPCSDDVRDCSEVFADVRDRDADVTLSETETETRSGSESHTHTPIAREKTARSGRDGFDAFWTAYPKKVARQAAVKAWAKIDRAVDTADIMAGLARAVRSEQWLKDGGQYVPHASTWLNGGRWTDALPGVPVPPSTPAPAGQTERPPILVELDPRGPVRLPIHRWGRSFVCRHEYADWALGENLITRDQWEKISEVIYEVEIDGKP